MIIDHLTIGEARQLAAMFATSHAAPAFDNGMIGKYVVVRCRDAGVHAGMLVSHNGRECVMSHVRRLWYWKVIPGSGDFIEAIANKGVHADSKVGPVAPLKHFTENCEIILASDEAKASIMGAPVYEQ